MKLLHPLLVDWLKRRLPPQQRVRLGQKHIFIVPSAAGYGFALCLLLILLVAINYQNSLAYAMVFLLAAIGMLSMLHTWRNLSGLERTGLGVNPCFAGDKAQVRLQLRSLRHAHQAIKLSIYGQPESEIETSVAATAQQQLQLLLPMAQRGLHAVPRIRVAGQYPLGLWTAWSQVDLDQQALVYPRPVTVPAQLAGRASVQGDDGLQAGGPGVDDYEGLVAWRPGDSLARVNWKSWSKGQGLLIKQFSELKGKQSELDFTALAGDVELRLSLLCAMVLDLSAQEIAYSLRLPDRQIALGQGMAHRNECLAALALFAGGRHV